MARIRNDLAVYFGLREPDSPEDPSEARRRARDSLKSPLAWLILIGAGLFAGASYEGLAAALGDGDFNVEAVAGPAVVGTLGALAGELITALRPAD